MREYLVEIDQVVASEWFEACRDVVREKLFDYLWVACPGANDCEFVAPCANVLHSYLVSHVICESSRPLNVTVSRDFEFVSSSCGFSVDRHGVTF